ncbi:NG,NG-dimethylarginine dimethylaminohydrolase 1 (EC [Olavius sp. associated proteobacterium Delta 1]|nr:NG,NG-dimethylarginine dimethylaminohydrolase 1 (EC [Olavius sp. associated proteobacterium Delta 1]
MVSHAITRKPCENFARGLTTTVSSEPADYGLMLKQHDAYLEALSAAGLEVIVLDPQPEYPDAHFVEDTAVVTSDVAVITIPGADTRKGEEESIIPFLAEFRKIERIQPPGTVDGGDVLQVGNHFFIGISERTNQEGAGQLGRILQGYGNTWTTVAVGAGLHFKSSVNYVGQNTLLVTSDFTAREQLQGYDQIVLDSAEAYAANTLLVNEHLLIPAGYPVTRKQLETLGLNMIELEVSELRKMDGGLTCMSLRF